MKQGDVHIHIDSLLLEGFAPGDRARIADGFQRELGRLVSSALPTHWRAPVTIERLDVASVTLPLAAPAERIGEKIASSIYRAASQESKS